MSVIINPRGTSGAGKTEFVRRIMSRYGWRGSGQGAASADIAHIHRPGRKKPIGYLLNHPHGGRPLAVIGHYGNTAGGSDTIPSADGGLNEALRLAQLYARSGHDVLIEGLLLSSEFRRTKELAARHRVHVLRLSTPLDCSIRNIIRRRRAARDRHVQIARTAAMHEKAVLDACGRLAGHAEVEALSFDEAIRRAERLLGLSTAMCKVA